MAKEISKGDTFHRLTVSILYDLKGPHEIFKCICQCGNEVLVYKYNLLRGRTKSCGCLKRELNQEQSKKFKELKEKECQK